MTKRREPLSAEQALTTIVGKIGWQRAAEITGKAERTMRHWSDPDIRTCISFDAAEQLDAEFVQQGGGYPPFTTLMRTRHKARCADFIAERACRVRRSARAAKEAGEAVAAQMIAQLPDATDDDRAVARRETEEAIAALGSTLPDLEASA